MDNFWVKAVIAVVAIAAVVVGINYFKGLRPEQPAPRERERTVGDVMREDDKRLRAEPNIATTESGEPQVKFRELTVEEQAGAEQLFEMAITSRKMARLPGMSIGQMVNYCRQIIEKYPGSEFDYKARRMLGEVPRQQWGRYNITEQEINPAQ
ncbi:MAG: hypothetical protein ABII09_00650 [Planctomycetota bacterium]